MSKEIEVHIRGFRTCEQAQRFREEIDFFLRSGRKTWEHLVVATSFDFVKRKTIPHVEIRNIQNTPSGKRIRTAIRKFLKYGSTFWQSLRVYLDVEHYNDMRYDCCTVPG